MKAISALLRRNRFLDELLSIEGNAKYCILTLPFQMIVYSLYTPFASLYMKELGLSDSQIGTVVTVGLISQMASSFIGGMVTDKIGRRKSNLLFDAVAYVTSALLMAVAHNFWYFVIAQGFYGLFQASNNAWNGLIGEDCEPDKISLVFSGLQVIQLLTTFLAPIAIFFIDRYDLVPTMRVIYGIATVTISMKILLLYHFDHETEMGKRRMSETRDIPLYKMFAGYRGVLGIIFKTPATFLLLAIVIIANVITVVCNNFFSLYISNTLGVSDAVVGYVPLARAAILLLFMFGVQHWINSLPYKPVMIIGLLIYIVGFVSLILARESLIGLYIYIPLEAVAYAFVMPRKDALLTLFVDKHDRSKVFGMLYVIVLGVSAPFGSIIGALSDSNQVYPLILVILLCVLGCLLVLFGRSDLRQGDAEEAPVTAGEL